MNGKSRSFASLRTTKHGFTLLELLVVLVLLAITAAAAVPAFLSDSLATPEQKTATALAALLSDARSAARESGAPATLMLSPRDGRYWLTTRDSSTTGTLVVPPMIRLEGANGERIECVFNPTGPASPITVIVRGTHGIFVRVHAWSGNIAMGPARAS